MRLSVLRKAKKLKNKVVYEGSGRGSHFYVFDVENSPKLVISDDLLLKQCTCKHHIFYTPTTPCSFYWACILKLMDNAIPPEVKGNA